MKKLIKQLGLLLLCVFGVIHTTQANVLSENPKNITTLEKAIKEIESKTTYTFIFDKNTVDLTESVQFSFDENNIQKTLDNLVKDKGLSYKIMNRKIILYKQKNNIN